MLPPNGFIRAFLILAHGALIGVLLWDAVMMYSLGRMDHARTDAATILLLLVLGYIAVRMK